MSKQSIGKASPAAVLGLGILAASTSSIFIRYAQQDLPSLVIAAYRLSIATLILAPVCFARYRQVMRRLTGKEWLLMALAGVFLGLHFATWITSLESTTVASSVVLVTTTPLWVALLAGLVLREKIFPMVWAGLAVAMTGSVLISFSHICSLGGGAIHCSNLQPLWEAGAMRGNMLALTGAVMAAFYLLIGRVVRGNIPLVPYIFIIYGIAALVLLGLSAAYGHNLLQVPGRALVWLVLLAVFPQLLGHTSFNWALRYLPASFVSISLMGEPIGTTLLAFLLLKETPLPLESLGGAFILAGIFIATQYAKQKEAG